MIPSAEITHLSLARTSASPVIAGIGTALPPLRVTQKETLEFILKNFTVGEAARVLYRRTMANPGIETRHFALESLEECLDDHPDHVTARFEERAAALATAALGNALRSARTDASTIDFLAVSTCTGYVCPGLGAHVLERAGLRPDVRLAELVGMGCGAAMPALEAASNFIAAHPDATAAVISVELCSAALFSSDEAGIIVSNALFADGAAAVILRATPPERNGMLHPRILSFASHTRPEWRESLRFKTENARLKNVLEKEVPEQAAEAVDVVTSDLLGDRARSDVARWIFHAGGPKVLDAIQKRFGFAGPEIESAREVLRRCGNMSSPTVLFVLAEECRRARPGDLAVMSSFGAGFTAHGALLRF